MKTIDSDDDSVLIAGDRRWQWQRSAETPPRWLLRWRDANGRARHEAMLDALGAHHCPLSTTAIDDTTLAAPVGELKPLSALSFDNHLDRSSTRLFESLGRWLRALHEAPSPSGFGDPARPTPFHTFNAYMAHRFQHMSTDLRQKATDKTHNQALAALTDLRNELAAFHPRGDSHWTVGLLSASRIAVFPDKNQVAGVVDLSAAALRPREYDLAALRSRGVIPDHPAASRAFWKGYQAAMTRDLERRIAYFERLIALEGLLNECTDRAD